MQYMQLFHVSEQFTDRLFMICRVHVRRTDKVGWEAELYSLDQYMEAVDSYYELLERRQHVSKRCIYLATDDDSVITEMKSRLAASLMH